MNRAYLVADSSAPDCRADPTTPPALNDGCSKTPCEKGEQVPWHSSNGSSTCSKGSCHSSRLAWKARRLTHGHISIVSTRGDCDPVGRKNRSAGGDRPDLILGGDLAYYVASLIESLGGSLRLSMACRLRSRIRYRFRAASTHNEPAIEANREKPAMPASTAA